jgi:hypothetical protein
MALPSGKATMVAVVGLSISAVAISPALGGPSLKKLVKKEVSKQLAKKPGRAGPSGPAGPPGADFDARATLPSGQTLTGVWVLQAGGGGANTAISFAPHLPSNLGGGSVHRIVGSSTTSACPGPGAAAAGHLCVYERASSLGATFVGIFDPGTGTPGANSRGAQIEYSASTGVAAGTWAATAP